MDVKPSQQAAFLQALNQAHVDPRRGRQGEFDHWQRIFDVAQGSGALAQQAPAASSGLEPEAITSQAKAAWQGNPEKATAGQHAKANATANTRGAEPRLPVPPRVSDAKPFASGLLAAPEPMASRNPTASVQSEPRLAPLRPAAFASAGEQTPDGRPLAQMEAHLSRSADGGLNVSLRSAQALSSAQALRAVAQALAHSDASEPVNQVLLNGQPIYRSAAAPSNHRFEIDC